MTRTPNAALVAQVMWAPVLLLFFASRAENAYEAVIDFLSFVSAIFNISTFLVIPALRRKYPHAPRPYRAWGYPWVPALYLLANAGIAVAMLIGRPRECAISLAMLATGLPFYWIFSRRRNRAVG